MKKLILIISILIISCAGKNGDGFVKVFMWDEDSNRVINATIYITYNTKKLEPKRTNDQTEIINGHGFFRGLKPGNYNISYKGDEFTHKCATQFRMIYETEMHIFLYSGQFKHQM